MDDVKLNSAIKLKEEIKTLKDRQGEIKALLDRGTHIGITARLSHRYSDVILFAKAGEKKYLKLAFSLVSDSLMQAEKEFQEM